jgi:hypothetical protein
MHLHALIFFFSSCVKRIMVTNAWGHPSCMVRWMVWHWNDGHAMSMKVEHQQSQTYIFGPLCFPDSCHIVRLDNNIQSALLPRIVPNLAAFGSSAARFGHANAIP